MGKATEGSSVDAADAAGGEEHSLLPVDVPLKQDSGMAVQRVEEHMETLKRIYTDLANVTEEHESSFESMDSHLLSTSMDIERGREEIRLPGKYWHQASWLGPRSRMAAGGSLAVL